MIVNDDRFGICNRRLLRRQWGAYAPGDFVFGLGSTGVEPRADCLDQPINEHAYAWGKLTVARIEHRQGRWHRQKIGEYFDQRTTRQVVGKTIPGRLAKPQAEPRGRGAGISAADQHARRQCYLDDAAITREFERKRLARARRDEANHPMAIQFVRGKRCAVLCEIGRARDGDLLHHAQPPDHHVAIGQRAGAHDAIHALAHQIDETLTFAEINGQCRMPCQEIGQRRQQRRAGEMADDIDTDHPGNRAAGTSIRILEIGEDGDAATVIGFALDRRLDVAGGTLQKPGAEARLQSLDGGGRDRPRTDVIRPGRAEAASFDDADEKVERGEPIHADYSIAQNNACGKRDLIIVGMNTRLGS